MTKLKWNTREIQPQEHEDFGIFLYWDGKEIQSKKIGTSWSFQEITKIKDISRKYLWIAFRWDDEPYNYDEASNLIDEGFPYKIACINEGMGVDSYGGLLFYGDESGYTDVIYVSPQEHDITAPEDADYYSGISYCLPLPKPTAPLLVKKEEERVKLFEKVGLLRVYTDDIIEGGELYSIEESPETTIALAPCLGETLGIEIEKDTACPSSSTTIDLDYEQIEVIYKRLTEMKKEAQ